MMSILEGCNGAAVVGLESRTGGNTLLASGTMNQDGTVSAVDVNLSARLVVAQGVTSDLDVIALDTSVAGSVFNRIDLHGEYNSGTDTCTFWGVFTPAS